MDAAGGKVPLDGNCAKEYQKLISDVIAPTRGVAAEQKKDEKLIIHSLRHERRFSLSLVAGQAQTISRS